MAIDKGQSEPAEKRTVLLVDDEEIILQLLSRKLEQTGDYETLTASDGEEAMDILSSQDCDLVITDLRMPVMGGLELLRHVRDRWPSLPVIIITGYGTLDEAIEALQLGAVNFIKKPFDVTEILHVVDRIFRDRDETGESVEAIRTFSSLHLTHEVPPDLDLFQKLIDHLLRELSRYWMVGEDRLMDLSVCLYEALLNALEHGTLEVPGEKKERLQRDPEQDYEEYLRERSREEPWSERTIGVELNAGPDKVTFVVSDEGPGFDIDSIADPTEPENILSSRGRGLLLIFNIANDVELGEAGNSIEITQYRDSIMQESE